MKVTGGQYKGRKIAVPEGQTVRPTSDRMRQSVFNILHHAAWASGFDMEGAQVMDVFCGSGALGIEALSHGAAHCIFVDKAALSLRYVGENTTYLDQGRTRIIKSDAAALGRLPDGLARRDLVFMDPPYRQDMAGAALTALHHGGWLKEGALIVIETEKNHGDLWPASFESLDCRRQGMSALHILRYGAAVEQGQ